VSKLRGFVPLWQKRLVEDDSNVNLFGQAPLTFAF
jgi:hypothetical protein